MKYSVFWHFLAQAAVWYMQQGFVCALKTPWNNTVEENVKSETILTDNIFKHVRKSIYLIAIPSLNLKKHIPFNVFLPLCALCVFCIVCDGL